MVAKVAYNDVTVGKHSDATWRIQLGCARSLSVVDPPNAAAVDGIHDAKKMCCHARHDELSIGQHRDTMWSSQRDWVADGTKKTAVHGAYKLQAVVAPISHDQSSVVQHSNAGRRVELIRFAALPVADAPHCFAVARTDNDQSVVASVGDGDERSVA
jgi:hypothetical protein